MGAAASQTLPKSEHDLPSHLMLDARHFRQALEVLEVVLESLFLLDLISDIWLAIRYVKTVTRILLNQVIEALECPRG